MRTNPGSDPDYGIMEKTLDHTHTTNVDLILTNVDNFVNNFLEELILPDSIHLVRSLESRAEAYLDHEQFRRCLRELIENACEAMADSEREGKEKVKRLVMESRISDDQLEIRVVDTGCGMSPEKLRKIFEPSLNSLNAKRTGTSRGLLSVKHLMSQLGGRVEIISEVGIGTTVSLWMWLPVSAIF